MARENASPTGCAPNKPSTKTQHHTSQGTATMTDIAITDAPERLSADLPEARANSPLPRTPHPIRHPGPAAAERIEVLRTGLIPLSGTLQPGETLTDGLHRIFAAGGCKGGVARMEGGSFQPFLFVGPSFPSDDTHAAWYSETRTPPKGARIICATATVGWREGLPFVHCHGRWDAEGNLPAMGHMLPTECVVAQPIRISAFGCPSAWFEGQPDAETNFTLYTLAGRAHDDESQAMGLLLRIRPHEDLSHAIEAACRTHNITRGRIIGLGSVISPDFVDAPRITCPITEIAIEDGRLEHGIAHIQMSAVDVYGTMGMGQIRRGTNPVCVTAELLVVAEPA